MYADLHVHSNYSDGSYSPGELIKLAEKRNIRAISLVDHNTVQGIKEFEQAHEKTNIFTIPGVEISSSIDNISIHILGYFINWKNDSLKTTLKNMSKARTENTKNILDYLCKQGKINFSWEQVLDYCPNKEWIGSSDVYKAMMKEGIFKSWSGYWSFYEKYFEQGDILNYILPENAIEIIVESGGIPILAHPKLIGDDVIVKEIIDLGVEGIEVYYPAHNESDIKKYYNICRENNLIITGGTDYHGKLDGRNIIMGDFGLNKKTFNAFYESTHDIR